MINPKHTKLIVATQWIICLLVWPVYAAAAGVKLELNRSAVICVYTFTDTNRVPHFIFMCFTLVGCIVTMFTNVALWNNVRRLGGKSHPPLVPSTSFSLKSDANTRTKQSSALLRQQTEISILEGIRSGAPINVNIQTKALLTTTVVTSLFLVSWIPTLIRYFMAAWPCSLVIPPPELDKVMTVTFSLGCWLNPIIYTIINRGFRNFVRERIRGRISSLNINSNS